MTSDLESLIRNPLDLKLPEINLWLFNISVLGMIYPKYKIIHVLLIPLKLPVDLQCPVVRTLDIRQFLDVGRRPHPTNPSVINLQLIHSLLLNDHINQGLKHHVALSALIHPLADHLPLEWTAAHRTAGFR